MARKIILDVDPGVADALALTLALASPQLEVVAATATGGNVSPEQATLNVQTIVEQLDPPRWPRIGAADPEQVLATKGTALWGPDGLCGAKFRVAELHHRHSSSKILVDEIKAAPGEITIIACGPLSNIAALILREPELATQVGHLIIVGGTLAGPGDVTATAEFNMFCDPESAKLVFRSPVTTTLLPIDVSHRVVLGYDVLDKLPSETTSRGRILRAILPGAFQAYHQRLGVEGMLVPEVVGVAAVLYPELFTAEPFYCDVETTGDITRGATIVDRRRLAEDRPNMDVVVDIDAEALLNRITRNLLQA